MTPNRSHDQPGAIKSTWQHETSLILAFFSVHTLCPQRLAFQEKGNYRVDLGE
jgi:hypothetical protein